MKALPLIALALLTAACHDEPVVPPAPSALTVVAGNAQTGLPGYRLANVITVRLVDDAGGPVIGDTVTLRYLGT